MFEGRIRRLGDLGVLAISGSLICALVRLYRPQSWMCRHLERGIPGAYVFLLRSCVDQLSRLDIRGGRDVRAIWNPFTEGHVWLVWDVNLGEGAVLRFQHSWAPAREWRHALLRQDEACSSGCYCIYTQFRVTLDDQHRYSAGRRCLWSQRWSLGQRNIVTGGGSLTIWRPRCGRIPLGGVAEGDTVCGG